jgi:hypothetical protein
LVDIPCREIDNDETNKYEIAITLSEDKNKTLNHSKNFQWLDVSADLRRSTTKVKRGLNIFIGRSLEILTLSRLSI